MLTPRKLANDSLRAASVFFTSLLNVFTRMSLPLGLYVIDLSIWSECLVLI